MKLIRILALLLALLMTLSVFVACNNEEEPPVTDDGGNTTPAPTPTPTPTPDTPAPISIPLVTESVTDYVIIYDYNATSEVVSAVKILQNSFEIYLGATISTRTCFSDKNEPIDVKTEKEILVGMTNRPESIETLTGMRSGDYCVTAVGSKIVLGGTSDAATQKAVTSFMTTVIHKQGDKFSVEGGALMNCTFTDLDVQEIAGTYSYTKCAIMDARIDSYYLIYADSDSNNSAACKTLADTLQEHINRETGFILGIEKDVKYWADYQILVGNTCYSEAPPKKLGADDYYLSLKKVEVTYEDGSKHDGAVIQILFGANAQEAAFDAFKSTFVKSSTTLLTQNITQETVVTNMDLYD